MADKVLYKFNSGKNNKALYYLRNYAKMLVPDSIYRAKLESVIASLNGRKDEKYILDRVNYYCKLAEGSTLPSDAPTLAEHRMGRQKVYYFDTRRWTRWFPKNMRWLHIPGDVNYIPQYPSIVKSRPITENNENGVLLKLNAVRHFIFVIDNKPFREKKNIAVFRGKVEGKPLRQKFFEKYFGNPICDLGDVSHSKDIPKEWHTEKMTIRDHLDYKFILALEGNDVASNLKWIMSSNSLAVMPKPRFETWFMEGLLKPGIHYVEIKDDFSDLEEKMNFYISHPEESQKIIKYANEWAQQFWNMKREKLISLLVLRKYFYLTGQ